MKRSFLALLLIAGFGMAQRQQPSPPAEASIGIDGKTISIKYSAPSLRGRTAFGPNGIVSKDPTYPIWRAGANSATALKTDATLQIGSLTVPPGNYTLFVDTAASPWQLIVNKQTGQNGDSYDASMDLGRVDMKMEKPPAPVEKLAYTLSASGNTGKLQLQWENHIASVPIRAK